MDALLSIADLGRRGLLRQLLRVPLLRWIFVDRRRRVPAAGIFGVVSAATLALTVPLVSLWLSAALLGVPHVIAGLRQVAVRERMERATLSLLGIALLIGAAQVAGLAIGEWPAQVFAVTFAAACACEVHASATSLSRAVPLYAAALIGAILGVCFPLLFFIVMAHVHGICALAYFTLRARRCQVPVWSFLLLAVTVALLALVGSLDWLMPRTLLAPRSAAVSIVLEAAGAGLRHPSAAWLRRALFLYSFGQSLHFVVWLRLLPEVERDTPMPYPFRRAYAGLRADLGAWALPAVLVSVLAVPAILLGGGAAREIYFALTYFHVGLEAAALCRLLARRRPT